MLKAAVITVSDRAYKGIYKDKSGPEIKSILEDSKLDISVALSIVPDENKKIHDVICASLNNDFIITTGGTGISPRDITPEVTSSICDREIPGLSCYLRNESIKETLFAVFSRGFCGVKGKTIIVNFPGSVKAAAFYTKLMIPLMLHGNKMLSGEGH